MLTSPWLGSLGRIGRNWMRFQAFKLMLPSHAVHQLIVSMIFSGVDNSGFAPPDRVAQLRKCAGCSLVPLCSTVDLLGTIDKGRFWILFLDVSCTCIDSWFSKTSGVVLVFNQSELDLYGAPKTKICWAMSSSQKKIPLFHWERIHWKIAAQLLTQARNSARWKAGWGASVFSCFFFASRWRFPKKCWYPKTAGLDGWFIIWKIPKSNGWELGVRKPPWLRKPMETSISYPNRWFPTSPWCTNRSDRFAPTRGERPLEHQLPLTTLDTGRPCRPDPNWGAMRVSVASYLAGILTYSYVYVYNYIYIIVLDYIIWLRDPTNESNCEIMWIGEKLVLVMILNRA